MLTTLVILGMCGAFFFGVDIGKFLGGRNK